MYRLSLLTFLAGLLALTLAAHDRSSAHFSELSGLHSEFEQWMVRHGKVYKTQLEAEIRFAIFKDNIDRIETLNGRRQGAADMAQFGLGPFSDMTEEEFKNTILIPYRKSNVMGNKIRYANLTLEKTPDSFDWTTKSGVVTRVRDQGTAGTCWAFAGLANVESLWALKNGKESPFLSTESLNDCDGYSDLSKGAIACGPRGATMPGFYYWVMQEGGIMKEDDYPYCVGLNTCDPCEPHGYDAVGCQSKWPIDPCKIEESCDAKYDKSKFVPGLKMTDFHGCPQDEVKLRSSLVEVAPLVVALDATDLMMYREGILVPDKCDPEALNHVVLLVGYGTSEDGTKFWRAKNSWGTSWGEGGYFRILRDVGACGINLDASTAVLG